MGNGVGTLPVRNHLVQLGVRDGPDPVAGEVEDLEGALHGIQRLDGDLVQKVVRGLRYFGQVRNQIP